MLTNLLRSKKTQNMIEAITDTSLFASEEFKQEEVNDEQSDTDTEEEEKGGKHNSAYLELPAYLDEDGELKIITSTWKGRKPAAASKKGKTKEKHWGIQENRDMEDFHSLVPEMAIDYPFELDYFQKEAIWHLERGGT